MASDIGFGTSTARLLSIGMAFLAGAVLMMAVPGLAGGPADTGPDPESPPFSTASGDPGCFDGEVNPNAGWVHEIAVGNSYAVDLNATIVHDAETVVRADVIPRSGNGYELALRTESETADRSVDCERVRTTFGMAASLPTGYEVLIVTVNGRELVRTTREDTTGDLSLPAPESAERHRVTMPIPANL